MTPTNVVSMNFKDKASLDDFVKMYQKDSPKLYPDAEILMFIKLTDTSAVAISVYPNEEARINSKKLAESRVSGELKQLFEEDFRLSGDMEVDHKIKNKFTHTQTHETCFRNSRPQIRDAGDGLARGHLLHYLSKKPVVSLLVLDRTARVYSSGLG